MPAVMRCGLSILLTLCSMSLATGYEPSNHDDDLQLFILHFTFRSNERRSPIVTNTSQKGSGLVSGIPQDNCSNPHDHGDYQNSCQFVLAECSKKSELINYLAFVVCDLPHLEVNVLCVRVCVGVGVCVCVSGVCTCAIISMYLRAGI